MVKRYVSMGFLGFLICLIWGALFLFSYDPPGIDDSAAMPTLAVHPKPTLTAIERSPTSPRTDTHYSDIIPHTEEIAASPINSAPQPAITAADTIHVPAPQEPEVVENQIVIQFAPSTTAEEKTAYIAELSGTVVNTIDNLNTVVVRMPENVAEEPLPQAPTVVHSEPDYVIRALYNVPPSDIHYTNQWGLPAINIPQAWQDMPADAPVKVIAIVDSGVCSDHEDLAGRFVAGWDFVEDDAIPQDEFGHGCPVSGVIAANIDNGMGVAGVAPNTILMPLRVLNATGSGSYSDVAAAITYAVDNGADIINLSIGGSNPSTTLKNAIDYAVANGVTLVAGAGNAGVESAMYPAAYPEVISVGSIDSDMGRSWFSNYGDLVDVYAPGSNIYSTDIAGGYTYASGTSFAAPFVSGVIALEAARGYTPGLSGGEIIAVVEATPEPDVEPLSICASVTDVPQSECEALVALYNSTNGPNWKNKGGWLTGNQVGNWYGVTVSGGHVTRLFLFSNSLFGTIPSEMGDLLNLERLLLQSNALSGIIPTSIGNLSQLTELNLFSNDLSGALPASIGSMTNLEILYLQNNMLTGSIPSEFGNLSNLRIMSLNQNQLEGSIPSEIGNLSNLESLILSDNNLTGSIPSEIGNISGLDNFSAHENQLTGSIPATLGNISTLRILRIDTNALTGSIPPELGNLDSLEYLGLNDNQLTGTIPPELGNLDIITNLYLSKNQLEGTLPSELGNLTTLQTLWLDSNKIVGEVPASFTSLTNLSFLYMQYNGLYATGETKTFLDGKQSWWADNQTIAPMDMSVTATTQDSISLSWTAIPYTANGGYYEISYDTDENGTFANTLTTTNKSATSQTITGLNSDTTYYIRIRTYTPLHASNQNDVWSEYSSVISATTGSTPNQPPVANAGADQTVTDNDGSGTETITLDGSGSTDSDGSITSYVWREDGNQIATGVNLSVEFAVGTHTVELTVTDDDGATATDTVVITVEAAPAEYLISPKGDHPFSTIYMEFEDFDLAATGYQLYVDGNYVNGYSSSSYCDAGICRVLYTYLRSDESPTTFTWYIRSTLGNLSEEVTVTVDLNGTPALSGTITNADTGAPIEKLRVHAIHTNPVDGKDFSYFVCTGADGSYLFNGLPAAGQFKISVDSRTCNLDYRPYEPTYYGGATLETATIVTPTASNLDIVLQPVQSITGRVINVSNKPGNTHDERITMFDANTGEILDYTCANSDGFYSFPGNPNNPLPETQVILRSGRTGCDGDRGFVYTYWDGVYNGDEATVIDLTTGDSFTNIDFEMHGIVADPGDDQTVADPEGDGESVTLDGSDSYPYVFSFIWRKDNVVVSTEASPTVNLDIGIHTFELTVENEDGFIDSDTVTITVIAGTPPVANAGADQTVTDNDGSGAESVTLDGSVSTDSDGSITSYVWREDGNQIATGVNPTVEFAVGTHTVELTVTDNAGFTATDTVVITVEAAPDTPPVADAGADQTVLDNDTNGVEIITLDGSGSTDVGGTIVSYEWRENNILLATGVSPVIEFSIGTYTLELTVIDDDGMSDKDEVVITITEPFNEPPVANAGDDQYLADKDDDGTQTVYVSGYLSSDPDGIIEAYSWRRNGVEIGNIRNPALELPVGTHNIELTVTDNGGKTATDTVTITVTTTGSFCNAITDVPQSECEALVALYTSMDGDGWSNMNGIEAWLTGYEVGNWYGVTVTDGHVMRLGTNDTGLSGALPPEIGQLSQLDWLLFEDENINGVLPAEIGQLSQLELLGFNNTDIASPLPPEIGQLSNLRQLFLRGNSKLNGALIPEIGQLSNLEQLDLSMSAFNSTLPPEWGQLTKLRRLDLADNTGSLSGALPPEWGNMSSLETLIITPESLTGALPMEWGQLTNLQTLYLQGQSLSGEIPASFTNLTSLTTLQIGYNALYATGATRDFITSKDADWEATQTIAPDDLQVASHTENSVTLDWTAIPYTANGGFYEISYKPNSGLYQIAGTTADKSANGFTVTGLQIGSTYQFRIRTFTPDAGGLNPNDLWSEYSEIIPYTIPYLPLVAPENLATTAIGRSSASLTWDDTQPAQTDRFFIERSADGSNWLEVVQIEGVQTQYTDDTLLCETTHQYRVRSRRLADGALSPYSNILPVTTDDCPAPVTNVVGLYKAGTWQFRDSNATGGASITFNFGPPQTGWLPIIGDWDGDGIDGIGLYKDGLFILRNQHDDGSWDNAFNFGPIETGWLPIVGDWNGDDIDSVGVYKNGLFLLSDSNTPTSPNYNFNFGQATPGYMPIAGDWNGSGIDTIGLYKDGLFHLSNSLTDRPLTQGIAFGPQQSGWYPLTGDWNEDGISTIGLYQLGVWRLRDSNSSGVPDIGFNFGPSNDDGWIPITSYRGDIDGLIALSGDNAVEELSIQATATKAQMTAEPTTEITEITQPEVTIEPTQAEIIQPEVTIEPTLAETIQPEITAEPTLEPMLEPTFKPTAQPTQEMEVDTPVPTAEPAVTEAPTAPEAEAAEE